MALKENKVEIALKAVISQLDYDIHKEIEFPEDPEDEDYQSYADWAQIFIEAYEAAE